MTDHGPALCCLEMRGISKRFGPTVALLDVELRVEAGEIHALVGENGAGKSTLMKVLSGAVAPDAGEIRLDGRPFRPASPIHARQAGVAMIYQELTLAPHLTVEANINLGVETHRFGWLRRGALAARARDALAMLEQVNIDPAARILDLGVGARQVVEVARALVLETRVVVMDEPTSSLPADDTERLFQVIERLADGGKAVVYISHFLEEIERLAHRFTVLRDGRHAGTGRVADTPIPDIIEMMVGRRIEQLFPRSVRSAGDPVLRLAGVTGKRRPVEADLELRRGEVLGIAGLVGAGRTEMLRAVYGLEPVVAGEVVVKSFSGGADFRPIDRISQGVGLLSEDRKDEGLAVGLSIEDNISLSSLGRYSRGGWLDLGRRRNECRRWMEALSLKARGPEQPIADLSGGNQQKAAFARLLHQGADVLLLDEPTRGIDVASKVEIYERIDALARDGAAVLLVSSYLPELLGLADRIAVMHRGRLSAARATADWTEESIMAAATGGDFQV